MIFRVRQAFAFACLVATAMALLPTAGLQPRIMLSRLLQHRAHKISAQATYSTNGQRGYGSEQGGYTETYGQDPYYYPDDQSGDYYEQTNYQQGGYQQGGDNYGYQGGYDDGRDQYGRDQDGRLHFDAYRAFVHDQYGAEANGFTEADLQRNFNELDNYARSYDGEQDQYTEAPSYVAAAPASKPISGMVYYTLGNSRGGRYGSAKLQEFLRWQEWYVQYCRLRGIGQSPYSV